MENTNEVFTPKVGMYPIKVLGTQLFTSFFLKKSYLFSMGRVPKLTSSMNKIKELTDEGKIVPCFLIHPGVIVRLIAKMIASKETIQQDQFWREELKHVWGFFSPDDDKICILINNKEINKHGFASNEKVASITIHESAHMAAAKKPKQFFGMFNSILITYYSEYFKSIFSLSSVNEQIVQQVLKLLSHYERTKMISRKSLVKYKDILTQFKDSSTADNFDKLIDDYFTAIMVFTRSSAIFGREANKFRHITNPLQSTYKKVFGGTDPGNLAIQELLFPSEIVAIGSEIGNNTSIINGIFKLL